ncbi:MAG: LiaF domain-containing protein, partial [Gemmatimonadota bacterium]
ADIHAQEWREFRAARQAAAVGSLDVEVFYGVGRLDVQPASGPFLYDIRLLYDAERFAPVRGWSVADDEGRLRVALHPREEEEEERTRLRLDDVEFDIDVGDLKELGDSEGRLDLALAPSVPMDLRLAVGAAESTLELGGLSLTSLEFTTGASETRLSFATPNRSRMREMVLQAGAADFQAENLGNARFDRFRFDGGIGDVVLDFGGAWEQDATVTVRMGLGHLELRVPADLGVRIERRSVLASFDATGFTRVDGAYQSPNWESAAHHVEFDLEAAFGAVSVQRIH